jgi:hypothetical protein
VFCRLRYIKAPGIYPDTARVALKRLLRPISPTPREPAQAITPDTVLLAHRSDADVLAFVDSTSLNIDENLIAQIRERIAIAEKAAAER